MALVGAGRWRYILRMAQNRKLLSLVAFPLFIVAVAALVWIFRQDFIALFKDRDGIRDWIRAQGGWGMLAFVGLQALQVILFMLPGEIVQVAGGYAFGFWLSTGLSVAGILVGSVVNFYVGRILGRPFVEGVFGAEKVVRIEKATSSGKGAAGFFLFFLIPGIPKDILCYVAGMSRLSLALFMAVSMGGRLPGILGSAFMGSATQAGSYTAAFVVFGIAGLLFLGGLLFKDRIEGLIGRITARKGK